MSVEKHTPLGELLEDATRDAIRCWLGAHRRGRERDDAILSDIARINCEVMIRAFRTSLCIVSIECHKDFKSEVYPYDLGRISLTQLTGTRPS